MEVIPQCELAWDVSRMIDFGGDSIKVNHGFDDTENSGPVRVRFEIKPGLAELIGYGSNLVTIARPFVNDQYRRSRNGIV